MNRCFLTLLLLMTAACTQGGSVADSSAAKASSAALDGKTLFHEKCAMCHGPIGMGTGLLERRVQPAELEKRDNLMVDYVITFARNGLGNMPAIPRGEASDEQLRAIAEYLAKPKPKSE